MSFIVTSYKKTEALKVSPLYGLSVLYSYYRSVSFDLLGRIIPTDVSDGLELIRKAGNCNCNNGEILENCELLIYYSDHVR